MLASAVQLVPSWDARGGATEEKEKFLLIVNQSIAAGSPESVCVVPPACSFVLPRVVSGAGVSQQGTSGDSS
jgi:hypothetical protein